MIRKAFPILFLLLITTDRAHALTKNLTESATYLSAIMGASNPSFGNTRTGTYELDSTTVSYGISVGMKVDPRWSLGIVYLSQFQTDTVQLIQNDDYYGQMDMSLSAWLLEGSYHFRNSWRGLKAGVQAGLLSVSVESTLRRTLFDGTELVGDAGTEDASRFALGPVLGYEYMMTDGMGLGLETSYLYAGSMDLGANGTISSVSLLNVFATLRLWL